MDEILQRPTFEDLIDVDSIRSEEMPFIKTTYIKQALMELGHTRI